VDRGEGGTVVGLVFITFHEGAQFWIGRPVHHPSCRESGVKTCMTCMLMFKRGRGHQNAAGFNLLTCYADEVTRMRNIFGWYIGENASTSYKNWCNASQRLL
jgi:hypothetical protein